MQESEALKLVYVAAAAHPDKLKLGADALTKTARVWQEALGDLPTAQVNAGLLKVLVSSEFWPTVASIREAALSLQPAALPTPEAAWAEVLREIRRVGWCGKPEWSHPAVGQAAEALYGGWANLCEAMTQESMVADMPHFLTLYKSYSQREREHALLPPAVKNIVEQLAGKYASPALPAKGATANEPDRL